MMQRLLILTFLVLFSSCGKDDDVFVFEGSAELGPSFEEWMETDLRDWVDYNMSADYSVQFTIIDEEVHYIVTLKNGKHPNPKGRPYFIYFDDDSKCYDEHGNVLFDFKDAKETERLDGVWKGVLNNVTAEKVSKVSKVEVEIWGELGVKVVPVRPASKQDIEELKTREY